MSNETPNPAKLSAASNGAHEHGASRSSKLLAPLGLTVSFWIIGVLGGGTLYAGWKSEGQALAVARCATYIILVAPVHWLGYRLWQRQFAQERAESTDVPTRRVSPAYWPSMKSALWQQNIIIILASLMLDMGQAISLTTVAVGAHWLAFGVVVLRRPSSPTTGDLLFVRCGFLLIFAAVVGAGPIMAKVLDRW